MEPSDLEAALKALDLPQNRLARLLGVTTRAIAMWTSGEREIPGPVQAYIKLLTSLPRALRDKKLTDPEKEPEMLEGMYRLDFAGVAGFGAAALVVKEGKIFGSDVAGVSYDGTYEPTGTPGEVTLTLTLTVPPGVRLVQGLVAGHQGFAFKVGPQTVNLQNQGEISVTTPVNGPKGAVRARISKLRNLPD